MKHAALVVGFAIQTLAIGLSGCSRGHSQDALGLVPPGNASRNLSSSTLEGDGDLWLLAVPEIAGDFNGDGDQFDRVLHVYSLARDEMTNLGFAVPAPELMCTNDPGRPAAILHGDRVVFLVSELAQGLDLNADGDSFDFVLHVYDASRRTVINSGFSAVWSDPLGMAWVGDSVFFSVYEPSQGDQDLDGDGSSAGTVLHRFELSTGEVRSLRRLGWVPDVPPGEWGGIQVQENAVSSDLNGDGDEADLVYHVFDERGSLVNSGLAGPTSPGTRGYHDDGIWLLEVDEGSQWNGDTNGNGITTEPFYFTFDPASGATERIALPPFARIAGPPHDGVVPFSVHEGPAQEDLNGDGDTSDMVFALASLRSGVVWVSDVAAQFWSPLAAQGRFAFFGAEREHERDLNGDGDQLDRVLQLLDAPTGETVNTGIACSGYEVVGERIAIYRDEPLELMDWNGDGDTSDRVLFVLDPLTLDLENVGWPVWYRHDAREGRLLFSTGELQHGRDANGDGDLDDYLLLEYDGRTGGVEEYVLHAGAARLTSDGFLLLHCEDGRDLNGDGFEHGNTLLRYPALVVPY